MGEFHRALSIAPRYVRAHNNLGVTLLELGPRPTRPPAEFRAVLAIDPRNVDAMVNLALAQRAAGADRRTPRQPCRVRSRIEPHTRPRTTTSACSTRTPGDALPRRRALRAFLQYAGPK